MRIRRFLSGLLPQTIAGRLVFSFLVIALASSGMLALLIDAIASRSLVATVQAHLLEVLARKTSELEDDARDLRRLASALARDPRLVVAADRLARHKNANDAAAFARVSAEARPPLVFLCEAAGLPDLILFDPSGRLLWHLDDQPDPGLDLKAGPLAGSPLTIAFRNAATLLVPNLSLFATYPGTNDPRAYMSIPLFGASGAVVGIAMLQLDTQRLEGLLRDTSGLGTTGLIRAGQRVRTAAKDQDFLEVLVPTSEEQGLELRRVAWNDAEQTFLRRAVQADRGDGRLKLDDGREYVAVWGYLPSYQWGLVVEQDVREAFSLVRRAAPGDRNAAGTGDGPGGFRGARGGPDPVAADPDGHRARHPGGRGRPDPEHPGRYSGRAGPVARRSAADD